MCEYTTTIVKHNIGYNRKATTNIIFIYIFCMDKLSNCNTIIMNDDSNYK